MSCSANVAGGWRGLQRPTVELPHVSASMMNRSHQRKHASEIRSMSAKAALLIRAADWINLRGVNEREYLASDATRLSRFVRDGELLLELINNSEYRDITFCSIGFAVLDSL